ncbi:MAG: SAM-dependent methyltransferase, partial [Pseudomonadota bacterium]
MKQSNMHDLTIIGAGINSFYQLTVEACDIISSGRMVYFTSMDNAGIAFLKNLNPNIQPSDFEEYQLGSFRPDMYERMADKVIDEATKAPGVVFLEKGSALVCNRVTQFVIQKSHEQGLSLKIIPGVSSIETLLTATGCDPGESGMQIFLAQNLILQHKKLDPSCAVIIMQPGYYDTKWYVGNPYSLENRFDALKEYLLDFYPPLTEIALVKT